jgi:tetratricopeptide (TPR) repeat protein
MAKGDHRRAAELFERAWKVSPLVETAWLLGDAREAMGDAKGAAEAYALVEREGRRTDPRTLSLFLSTKGRNAAEVEEALKLAREEYEVRKDITSEDALAWAYYRTGRIAEAKASIAKARRLGTPDARLMFHEGAIHQAGQEARRRRAEEEPRVRRHRREGSEGAARRPHGGALNRQGVVNSEGMHAHPLPLQSFCPRQA